MLNPRQIAPLLLVSLLAAAPTAAQDLEWFEQRVTEKELDNGLTVLVYERPGAPVVAFYTYVDVGAAQEVAGITGLAHMFEHMAFKGTTRIGTSGYEAEKMALDKVDVAYHAYDAERRKPGGPDPDRLAELEQAFTEAKRVAGEYVVKNEFTEIIERAGGVGLNATTNSDRTAYFYSLPANKVELWAYLESERFRDPILREFYTERDVVMEERRLRTDSNPIGRLIEQMLAAAFIAHPYGYPTVGYMSDLQSFTREDALAFYETYYPPSSITLAIAGAIDADEVLGIVEQYFGRLPAGPDAPTLRTVEPKQIAERTVVMPDASQPLYVEGYLRPPATHPDSAVYGVMADVLSTGRTSRLYRRLVRDEKIAAQTGAFNGFPGSKYQNLMVAFAFPVPGHSNEEVQAAIREEIDRIRTEPVSAEELAMVKTRAKAGLIRSLASNTGIAGQLATAHALYGDWREVFRSVERIEAVTTEDVLRVAAEAFRPTQRTTAMIVNESESPETGSDAGQEEGDDAE